ncbi:hypothetical protein EVJ50_05955 [Synechococcus sp. RSCCF101]|nr:hypothetical protein EVJ50_05955 [Synechococcus sp. RSCCF101]
MVITLLALLAGPGMRAVPAPAAVPFASDDPMPGLPATIDQAPLLPDTLRVGMYLTQLDGIDLHNASFNAQLYLWTLWPGDEAENPSDDLTVLNSIFNADLDRFERLSRERIGSRIWSLYTVHGRFVHRWRLDSYPFDSHLLNLQVGYANPLRRSPALEVDTANSGVSPTLYLYGWQLGESGISLNRLQTLSNLGDPRLEVGSPGRAEAVTSTLEISRRASLYLVPDFLGYMLAIGLCVLALVIHRTRDDLILAAVVSAAGNYVFLAGILPVDAMAGFIGQLQLVILVGILYVIGADEIIDHQMEGWPRRWRSLLQSAVLPSYLLLTMSAIYALIPRGVVSG